MNTDLNTELDEKVYSAISTSLELRPSEDEAKLNKMEQCWLAYLRTLNFPFVGVQNITFKLGHDCRYTPDFVVVNDKGQLVAYETKGFFREDAIVKVRVTARLFRFLKIIVVTRKNGIWYEEEVKP